MKQILDEIENMVNNAEETAAAQGIAPKEDEIPNSINGIINDNAGGLGTIKDEDSNADSDFSGDEQTAVAPVVAQ